MVEVFLDELPEDADEICEILLAEAAPLTLFHDFALEYWRRGNAEAFERVLRRGIAVPDARDAKSGDAARAQARMKTTLAAHLIGQALEAQPQAAAERLTDDATDLLNDAERRTPKDDEHLGLRKGTRPRMRCVLTHSPPP